MMVVQSVNRLAVKKYEELVAGIELVRLALEAADPLIKRMGEAHAGRPHGWQVPDKKEVLAARKKAGELLDTLRAEAKTWEKEWVANGWRV